MNIRFKNSKRHRLVSSLVLCLFVFILTFAPDRTQAQCSICTRTAQQLGERPAKALNRGIVYLAFMPLGIFGVIGYRWWKSEKSDTNE